MIKVNGQEWGALLVTAERRSLARGGNPGKPRGIRGRWLTQGAWIKIPAIPYQPAADGKPAVAEQPARRVYVPPKPYSSDKPKRGEGGFTGKGDNRMAGRGALLRAARKSARGLQA